MDSKKLQAKARQSAAAKARSRTPEWIEANTARYQDPSYKERWSKSIKKAYEDPALKQRQAEKASYPRTAEEKEKIRQARLVAPPRSKSTKAKIGQAQVGNTKHCKPLTTDLGIFASLKLAGEYHEVYGLINAKNHIRKRIREQWEGYRYITKEEYKKLTGKQI